MNKISEMRIVRIVMLVALCAGASSAGAHVPVDGDKYSRDHIAGFERGDSGREIVWNLQDMEKLGVADNVSYRVIGDSLVIRSTEDSQSTYYLHNGGVFLHRMENRLIKMVDSVTCEWMPLLLEYGEKVDSPYIFRGVYCDRFPTLSIGDLRASVDAIGKLILPTDTLENVIRLHRNVVARVNIEQNDTLTVLDYVDDYYAWYSEEYRYPIVESGNSVYRYEDGYELKNEYAYYYAPENQEYDKNKVDENQRVRSRNSADSFVGENEGVRDVDNVNGEIAKWAVERCSGGKIEASFTVVNGNVSVAAIVYGLDGIVYGYTPSGIFGRGEHRVSVSMDGVACGRYLMTIESGSTRLTKIVDLK